MKNKIIVLTLFVLMVLGLVAMGRSCKHAPAKAPIEKMGPSEQPAVRMLLQINLASDTVIYPGFPLIAEVDSVPQFSDIKPEFEVLDNEQKKQKWSWEQAADKKNWLIEMNDVQKIEPGSYQVRAIVEHDGKKFRSNPVNIEMKKSGESEEEKKQAQFFSALYFGLKGDNDKALSVIDSLTQNQKLSLAFEMKGSLLEKTGHTADALTAYEQALATYKGEIPPADLVRKKRELWLKVSEEFRKANPNYKPAPPTR